MGHRAKMRFRHGIVDGDNPPDPHCKAAGDIDGDGFPDLLAASASGGGLFWYRYPDWSKHHIAEGTFTTGSHNIVLVDVNRTGWLDIYGANWNNRASTGGAIELWLNLGQE